MSEMHLHTDGFDELEKILKHYQKSADKKHVLEAIASGAAQLAADVRRLPRPRSRVRAVGYEHLLDTVTYEKKENEVKVGWGKYYGRMVENGTKRSRANPHLKPQYQSQEKKYVGIIRKKLFG